MALTRKASSPAYFLVDISELSPQAQALILEDAALGGGDFGVKVCEIAHNGPAQTPIYGVYYGDDEQKWKNAQAEFAIEFEADDETEEEIRERAQARTDAEAEAAAAAEAAAKPGNKAKV